MVRHGESQWNLENRFTGWTDVDLSPKGAEEAKKAGALLKKAGITYDWAFTSVLRRAIKTLHLLADEAGLAWVGESRSWRLNERHYGALQGLNKAETAKKYGDEQVRIWRRSFDVAPPMLEDGDERSPRGEKMYSDIDRRVLPMGESLKTTIERVIPFWTDSIAPLLMDGKDVIIVAHGNSLRALVMQFEKLTPEEILEVNIPTGVPCAYTFDKDWNVVDKHYIGDPATIEAKINAVANQGKVKK